MFAESLAALASGLELWRGRKNDGVQARRHRQEAIGFVMDAVVATKSYLYDLDQGARASRVLEQRISRAWQHAATAIREYDRELYQSAHLKAMGWADPREWKHAESRPWAVKLDTITAQCEWLQEHG